MFVRHHTTVNSFTTRNKNTVMTSYKGYDVSLVETMEEIFKDNKDIINVKIEHHIEEGFEHGYI